MRRGTTAQLVLDVEGIDLSDSASYILFRQNDKLIQKRPPDLQIEPTDKGCKVTLILDQKDTLTFKPGKVNLQIRWVDHGGAAYASPITSLRMDEILNDEVIDGKRKDNDKGH